MSNLEKIKLVVFGPKPKRVAKYAGVTKQWGWSSEVIYKWRNTSYDNLEKQMVASAK